MGYRDSIVQGHYLLSVTVFPLLHVASAHCYAAAATFTARYIIKVMTIYAQLY